MRKGDTGTMVPRFDFSQRLRNVKRENWRNDSSVLPVIFFFFRPLELNFFLCVEFYVSIFVIGVDRSVKKKGGKKRNKCLLHDKNTIARNYFSLSPCNTRKMRDKGIE